MISQSLWLFNDSSLFCPSCKGSLKVHLQRSSLVVHIQVRDHPLLIGRHVQDEAEEGFPQGIGGEVHLEVVGVDVEEEAPVVAFVVPVGEVLHI